MARTSRQVAGIHLVACIQKPASALVGGLAKANFPVRLVGRVTSPEEAKVATGYAGTGAERLRGPGDFIAVMGGQVTRFQAAHITAQELAEVVGRTCRDGQGTIELPEPKRSARAATTDKIAESSELKLRQIQGLVSRRSKAPLLSSTRESRDHAASLRYYSFFLLISL